MSAATVDAAGIPASAQVTKNRVWAVSWLAAARAVRSDLGVGQPQEYEQAAIASAVHAALSELVPSRQAELNAALERTLDRIPDGPAEDRGVRVGREQARVVLADRANDGLDPESVNGPYQPPAPGPGVWQPTPPTYGAAIQAGSRYAKPFLLDDPAQFRLGPPPELGSERYRADLAEVRALGVSGSAVRTDEQTRTAKFWEQSTQQAYTGVLRAALEQSRQPLFQRVGMVAIFNVALVDTQIAASDSKYTYARWRPVTAIRAADDGDGDPGTTPDPGWTPEATTPLHPDYPSGHNTYAGAAEAVLTALTGEGPDEAVTIGSSTAPGEYRTYAEWSQLTAEVVDARVWSGLHTRTADEAGVVLGRDVAEHDVRMAFQLLR
ncbi:vanadium-dependent haloperoxidase [Saccharopolyspora sp. WRP15-2]|uniref:Vanadium-dependent haloperoxidase n=1 Tax=Saccharopolyspora oryzae TaxID=2997343 RepID=A0ABT4UQF7_9PSEU|nr:vanadium-dependent haloperoxidase [Saccharopolyspora oryzae]MDA3623899.1 vanadium-dependent haloperoxidase [Saccharopolyspora oryzae]